jgi:hypothetical protein
MIAVIIDPAGIIEPIEFTRNDEQPHGNCHYAEIGCNVQPSGHACRLKETRSAENQEEKKNTDHAKKGAGLWPSEQISK